MLGIVEGNLAWSLLSLTGTATTVAAARAVRLRTRKARLTRRLAELEVDLPLDTRHLSPALATLTSQARMLRIVLATPLQRMPDATWHDTPWRRRSRCDEYDRALVDARRHVWDWLLSARSLSVTGRAILLQLGLSVRRVSDTLFAPGVLERTSDPWEEVLFPAEPDYDRVATGLCDAMADLARFEIALLSVRPDPYR